jgi:hypothetical protein
MVAAAGPGPEQFGRVGVTQGSSELRAQSSERKRAAMPYHFFISEL